MVADDRHGAELSPPPLSESTEDGDFAQVRLPWTTPLYLVVAALIARPPPDVAIPVDIGDNYPFWRREVVIGCVWALVVGSALVAGDRLSASRWRVTRWLPGLTVGALIAYGSRMGPLAVLPGLAAPPTDLAPVLVLAFGAAKWVLCGASCALATRRHQGVWWRLPAASGVTGALVGCIRRLALWAVGPRLYPPREMWLVVWFGLEGALIGLALAAGLAQAHRSARRARRKTLAGTGPGEG